MNQSLERGIDRSGAAWKVWKGSWSIHARTATQPEAQARIVHKLSMLSALRTSAGPTDARSAATKFELRLRDLPTGWPPTGRKQRKKSKKPRLQSRGSRRI